jgi:uncharacterized Tic20 family protein
MMSDPTQPEHHGDQPQHDPTAGPGGFGMPPTGPPPQGQPGLGPQPPAYTGPPAYNTPAHPVPLTPDELTWGGAAHWSALVAAVVALAFLGPLVVMLTKGNESAYVRAQAVESLNFQLSILIYGVVSFVLVFVLVGFLLLPIVGIAWLVFTIIGSVRASRGELYRYPLTIRMVS